MPDTVTATDGVVLAVHRYTDIDPQRPTILAIHGYPDNHHVWDAVAERLVERDPRGYNVVAYDVRGAGGSAAPAQRSGYRFSQLLSDLETVIEHLGVDSVHLLGHDWGSIQGWAAVTDAKLSAKIGSYTSISGPHLDYAGSFLRSPRTARALVDVAKQVLASTYILVLLTPRLPEALFRLGLRSGLSDKIIGAVERIGGPGARTQRPAIARSSADLCNGVNLYRANMPAPFFFPAAPLPQTDVAVQVLVPRGDVFVTQPLQRFTGAIPANGLVVAVDGGHWAPTSHPEAIARLVGDWIEAAAPA